uniref:FAM109A n=1 Tax=Lepeophtheirus salmonis TaxID=72036 RepID=C1BTT8_LEPSM|nr:FAM109A [Lepeophtheirus salmonis]
MKINDRTLCHYAVGPEGFDKDGILWKRGEVNKNFQKRYFVLKGNLLFYFEKKGDKEPLGLIVLEGCTIELAEEEQEKFAFKIVFHGEGRRSYVLGAETQEMVEEWMKLLACAPYDYMKLMVLELQQQLQELDEADRLGVNSYYFGGEVNNIINNSSTTSSNQRVNPFDCDHLDGLPKNDTFTKTWQSIHCEYGRKISRDRQRWCQRIEDENRKIIMRDDDTLIVKL